MTNPPPLPPSPLLALSSRELLRWQAVALLRAKLSEGKPLKVAVAEVVGHKHQSLDGARMSVMSRSLRRWHNAFVERGIKGLQDPKRSAREPTALPAALLDFLKSEKGVDRYASVPELIRRARQRGILGPDERVDRSTVWRACVRLQLPLRRLVSKLETDQRRWAYPHRMMMVLADGKYFRAGIRRSRRVAFFFLDDACRLGLAAVVGTSENPGLFLRGLFKVITRVGLMDSLFLDNGPGFIAEDVALVCARLGVNLILGTAGYPEGHGKIERFNQTAGAQLLRGLAGSAEVDDDCGALTLRVEHWLTEQYNRTDHEALS